jgi:hypothetical protein
MQKKFSELKVGDKFILNGTEYQKIDTVRISCCSSINANSTANAAERKMISDDTVVVINA